ncbi:class V aminotransferase [Terricaulis sp.]|uniref:class V aminotransferase n=1 Tax=Terricaulis sp. TaxID=2768686 RepID=UPI003782E8EF
MSSKSYKPLFSRAFAANPDRLHFAAHSHHLWPDASFDGHVEAWNDAAAMADRKWDKVFGEVMPRAQENVARELNLPDPSAISFAPNTHELLVRIFSARAGGGVLDVLTSDGEFHAFRRQAGRWEEGGRIRRRIVPCEPYETFGARFLAAMREKAPDVAFLSTVMFNSGLRFDHAADLASHAKPDGTWVVFDLYHSFMAMPSDFSTVADRAFLLGGGYKYAMSGEGAGYIHAPPAFAERPINTGWFADFGAMEHKQGGVAYGKDGSRFLGATYDPTALYRFNAVRAMLTQEGLTTDKITNRVAPLREKLLAALEAGEAGALRDARILKPNARGPQARFIALRDPRAVEWKNKLMAANIVTDARDDVLRIGLGLYHDEPDIAAFCEGAKKALG